MAGKLYTWGRAANGRLGNGTTTPDVLVPTQIGSDTDWDFISTGESHSLAIRNGQLWAWGPNGSRELGDGTTTQRNDPIQIGSDTDWLTVAAGNVFSLALKTNGTLWSWGSNGDGRTGQGTTSGTTNTPTQVGSDTDWAAISAGRRHALALKTDETLWSWGDASNGKLGNNTTSPDISNPTQVGSDTDWEVISAGEEHSLALKTTGTLWACGSDYRGQQGNGSISGNILVFTQIGSDTDWTNIATGAYSSYGLKSGQLWSWGYNTQGQLGLGDTNNRTSPTQVGSDNDWTAISSNLESFTQSTHALAIKAGSLWACGYNLYGQVGDNSTTSKNSFVQIDSATDWLFVSAGAFFSAALQTAFILPANTVAPAISGTAKVGQTLTTDDGTWTGTPTPTYTKQWQVSEDGSTGWADISGATSSTYTITASEAGKYIRSKITATNDAGAVDAFSSATAQITQNPTNTVQPVVTGTAKVGETLTTDNGTWQSYPSATYAYQWQSSPDGLSWSNISGATSGSFTPATGEAGLLIRVRVTATNSEDSVDAFSLVTSNVLEDPAIDQVTITGLPAKVDNELTASASATAGYPAPSISYQWFREIEEVFYQISGANTASYTPTSTDAGLILKVIATATNSEGQSTSQEVTEETLWAPANTSIPTISYPNYLEVDETLTADPGEWTGYPDPETVGFSYQWQVSDDGNTGWTNVLGETGTELYLDESFAAKYVRIKVTSTTTAGTTDAYSVTTGFISQDPEVIVTPLISGTTEINEVLTVDPGEWGGFPEPDFTYIWERSADGSTNWQVISGETADQLTLTSSEVSFFIRSQVTATNPVGSATAASEVVGPVLQAPFLIDAPEITGNARQAQTLTLDIGEWGGFEDPTLDVDISWEISPDNIGDWETIEGADQDSYLIPENDDLFGYYIRALVDVTNSAGSLAEYSNSLGPIDYRWTLPVFIEEPTVDGVTRVNSTLEVSFDFDGYPAPTAFIQWQRQETGEAWENIAGEEGTTYLVQEIDLDYIIRAQVTLINDEGSTVAYSDPTEQIEPELIGPALIDDPEITGSFEVSKKLTAYLGDYSGYPDPELAEDGLVWEYAADPDGPWRPIQEIDQQINWIPDEDFVGYYLRLVITVENVVSELTVVSNHFGPVIPRLYVQPQVLPVTNARLVSIHAQNGGNIGVEFDSEFTLDSDEQRNRLLWHGNSDAYLRFKTAVKYSSGQMDKVKETTVLIPKFIEVDQGTVLTIFYNKKTYTYRVADVTEINQDPAMAPMLKCVLIDPGFSDDPQFEN